MCAWLTHNSYARISNRENIFKFSFPYKTVVYVKVYYYEEIESS